MAIFNVNLNIHYSAPQEVWDKIENAMLRCHIRTRLTKTLGYSIGEPEDGYEFKFWE